ncbi:tellurite resistance TerB family protein [Pseudohaliea rubra]|uniref:Co-chaperone DjlA N-terminal domain-containing protein n=1 Tax=Pseudohaliea rubra DSM 19751 TaxID=1265313 RepID=A0A095VVS4_9GAMM|nr:TerB family tellurite resistance protein [Pseudohaliea rubra]KGE05103.1 hypothetical protein HRUBRA_00305 [Pseudohaliea rubra DSM 19751]
MIGALKALFEPARKGQPEVTEHQLHLAAATLLIETARADARQDGVEEAALTATLKRSLGLSEAELSALLAEANAQADAATSLYQFTRLINDHFTPARKQELIIDMWKVAYADGDLDKYEEHLIRRVAELIYVPHEDYIRAKLAMSRR